MTLKEIINESGRSRNYICKKSKISYSTLADLINGRRDVFKMNVRSFEKLGKAIGLSLINFYELLSQDFPFYDYPKVFSVTISNYNAIIEGCLYKNVCYAIFKYENATYQMEVCKLDNTNYPFIKDIIAISVVNKINSIIAERAGGVLNDIYINEEKHFSSNP